MQTLAMWQGPFGQQFVLQDLPTVAVLVLLEGLLSGDNALVLAIMVRHLPKIEQQRALLYGLGGAFVFRLVAIVFAQIVLKQWWLQAAGAGYLIVMAGKHLLGRESEHEVKPVGKGFWPTVIAVEITDIAFAVDSVLAGVTFIHNQQSKIWVVFFGAIIGIVLLRFAAGFFVRLLDRYPVLDRVAYMLVGWVGVKLAFLSAQTWSQSHPESPEVHELPHWLFWTVLIAIVVIGSWVAYLKQDKNADTLTETADLIDDASDLKFEESPTQSA